MNEPITILIVDDHTIVRQGVRTLLEMYPDLQVLGEAESAEAALALVAAAPHQGGQQRRTQGQCPYSAPSHSSSPPSSAMRGNRAVNRAPTPSGPRWAMISPPWRRAVSRAMDSPRPVPPACLDRALSTR